jgi:hypothetical protein
MGKQGDIVYRSSSTDQEPAPPVEQDSNRRVALGASDLEELAACRI